MKTLILLLFSLLLFSCDDVTSNNSSSNVEIITGSLKDLAVYRTLNNGRVVIDDFIFNTNKTTNDYYIVVELDVRFSNYTEETPIWWDECDYGTTKYRQYIVLDYEYIVYDYWNLTDEDEDDYTSGSFEYFLANTNYRITIIKGN